MQSYIDDDEHQVDSKKDVKMRDIKKCTRCYRVCDKVRTLPCQDVFCKDCLQTFFSTLLCSGLRETFPCPTCGQETDAPKLPVSKWTKAFQIDKRTQFYSESPVSIHEKGTTSQHHDFGRTPNVPIRDDLNLRKNILQSQTQSVFIPAVDTKHVPRNKPLERSASERPRIISRNDEFHRRGTRRTAVHFHGYDYYSAFDSHISSDARTCQYWGGDVSPKGGNIVLADWMNKNVKLFNSSGQYKTGLTKLPHQPLCVTYIRDDLIVLTFGSRSKSVMFLKCLQDNKNTKLGMWNSKSLHGFMYSTTRFEQNCLGVFETKDGKFCVMSVYVNVSKSIDNVVSAKLEPMRIEDSVRLSSNSGIRYCHKTRKIYLTEKTTLYSLNTVGKLLNQHSYVQQDTDNYNLGCVTTDPEGGIIVAADLCVLRLNEAGTLLTVIPTNHDPYCVISTSMDTRFLVLGRSDQADVVLLK